MSHVAPVITIDGTEWVIDPALIDGPVTIEEWKLTMENSERAFFQLRDIGEAPYLPNDFYNPAGGLSDSLLYPGNGFILDYNPPGDLVEYSLDRMKIFSRQAENWDYWKCFFTLLYGSDMR